MIPRSNKLTEMQIELLKSFKHLTSEKQINEVKSLLNFYFSQKLDESIDREEKKRGYLASIYEEWLRSSKK